MHSFRYNVCYNLELDQVWLVGFAQCESGGQISTQQLDLINISLQGGINGLLGGLSLRGSDGGLGGLGIEQSLLTDLAGGLLTGEEGIVDLGHINASSGDVGGGGNHVSLVNSAQRNAIDIVWA